MKGEYQADFRPSRSCAEHIQFKNYMKIQSSKSNTSDICFHRLEEGVRFSRQTITVQHNQTYTNLNQIQSEIQGRTSPTI